MAVNLALGVPFAAGVIPVHRNFVTLKPKATTMASYAANNPNPVSKYCALQVLTTQHTNLVATGRKRMTVEAAASSTTDQASQTLPIPIIKIPATIINFKNSLGAGLNFNLVGYHFWKGDEKALIPKVIGKTEEFKHNGDDEDGQSVGSLVYLIHLKTTLLYWTVAWRNIPNSPDNKVCTKIISVDKQVPFNDDFWNDIYGNLIMEQHTDEDHLLGYAAKIEIISSTLGKPTTIAASIKNV